MKYLSMLLCLFTVLSSLTGCDFFNPQAQLEDLSPVDSMAVFHNFINSYNTLDYEAFRFTLDSVEFTFIPEDTSKGVEYKPWGFGEETDLTYDLFNYLSDSRRIPPLILQVDTSYFSTVTEDLAYLHANYLLITPVDSFDTLGGGMELELQKRGNYWYITRWEEVIPKTIYYETEDEEGETVTDSIVPLETDPDWDDLKVYFLTEYYIY